MMTNHDGGVHETRLSSPPPWITNGSVGAFPTSARPLTKSRKHRWRSGDVRLSFPFPHHPPKEKDRQFPYPRPTLAPLSSFCWNCKHLVGNIDNCSMKTKILTPSLSASLVYSDRDGPHHSTHSTVMTLTFLKLSFFLVLDIRVWMLGGASLGGGTISSAGPPPLSA